MSFEVGYTHDFAVQLKALAKRHRSIKNDVEQLAQSLSENPFQGTELAPGIRKIRMSITSKGRGKSGGARVITYTVLVSETEGNVFLMNIYDKADYSTAVLAVVKDNVARLNT